MTLAIQKFLRDGCSVESMQGKYSISSKRHPHFPNLVLFKYNQIESPFTEQIVREARGIILDESDNWRVVCKTFDKFFNYGEGLAATIEWGTAKVQEKVDGSLCTLYFHEGWQVATSGTPDAGGLVYGCDFTFQDLFWRTFSEMGLTLPSDEDVCYSFELTSPFNRVVVPHKASLLTFIGCFNRKTLEEYHLNTFPQYPAVRQFNLQTFQQVIDTFSTMSPTSQEGYVVVDDNFNRVKMKSPAYVALHHMKNGFGTRRMVELVRLGETSEVCSYFPEFADELSRIKQVYDSFVCDLEGDYLDIADIPTQKEFALKAVQTRCSGAMFSLRAGKVGSVREYLSRIPIRSLMDMLKIRDYEETLS